MKRPSAKERDLLLKRIDNLRWALRYIEYCNRWQVLKDDDKLAVVHRIHDIARGF